MNVLKSQAEQNICIRLYRQLGIKYVGEIVQMTRDQLLPYARNKDEYIDRIEASLREINLYLASVLPDWTPPPDIDYAKKDFKKEPSAQVINLIPRS